MKSKFCQSCTTHKPLAEYYSHESAADGLRSKCKPCMRQAAIDNRARKLAYYREYDRMRDRREDRRAAKVAYASTPEGRSAANQAKRQWRERNTVKRAAQIHTRRAVRDGRLIRPDACEECGAGNVHGHHDDYAMPLAVRWLCAGCHKAWHRAHGCGKNG